MATRIRPLAVDVSTNSGPIKGYQFYAKGIDEQQGILDVEVTHEAGGQGITFIDRQHVSVNVPKKRKQYAFALCGKTDIDAEKIEAVLQELLRAVETFLRERGATVGGQAGPESSAGLSRAEALHEATQTLFGGALEIVELVRRCSEPVWYRMVTSGGTAYFNEGELVHQGTFFKIVYNQLRRVIPRFKPAQWDAFLGILQAAMVDEAASDVETDAGKAWYALKNYLEHRSFPIKVPGKFNVYFWENLMCGGAFLMDGLIWFQAKQVYEFTYPREAAHRITAGEFYRYLKKMGAEKCDRSLRWDPELIEIFQSKTSREELRSSFPTMTYQVAVGFGETFKRYKEDYPIRGYWVIPVESFIKFVSDKPDNYLGDLKESIIKRLTPESAGGENADDVEEWEESIG